jgi:clathrin heavy chain
MMTNPSGAVALAKMIAKQSPQPVETNTMADLFLQRNMVREATAFLLDALANDKPEQGILQTKLLEINLITNPQVTNSFPSLPILQTLKTDLHTCKFCK